MIDEEMHLPEAQLCVVCGVRVFLPVGLINVHDIAYSVVCCITVCVIYKTQHTYTYVHVCCSSFCGGWVVGTVGWVGGGASRIESL